MMVADALRTERSAFGAGTKTLVVEDDEPVASMLCFLLEEEGYRCVQARRAEDAWRHLLGEVPRAAVVDLRLPGKDGWWLLRKVRANERTHRVPVVLITGFLDDEVEEKAAELGCVCLTKPFSLTDLTERLELAEVLAGRLEGWLP